MQTNVRGFPTRHNVDKSDVCVGDDGGRPADITQTSAVAPDTSNAGIKFHGTPRAAFPTWDDNQCGIKSTAPRPTIYVTFTLFPAGRLPSSPTIKSIFNIDDVFSVRDNYRVIRRIAVKIKYFIAVIRPRYIYFV